MQIKGLRREITIAILGVAIIVEEPEEKVDLRVYLIEVNNAVKKIKNQLIIDNKRVKAKEAEFTAKNKIKE